MIDSIITLKKKEEKTSKIVVLLINFNYIIYYERCN